MTYTQSINGKYPAGSSDGNRCKSSYPPSQQSNHDHGVRKRVHRAAKERQAPSHSGQKVHQGEQRAPEGGRVCARAGGWAAKVVFVNKQIGVGNSSCGAKLRCDKARETTAESSGFHRSHSPCVAECHGAYAGTPAFALP